MLAFLLLFAAGQIDPNCVDCLPAIPARASTSAAAAVAAAPNFAPADVEAAMCRIEAIDATGTGWGSGVHLGDGYVATCAHVVRQAQRVRCLFPDGAREAKVLAADQRVDIAVLQVDEPPASAVEISGYAPQIGQTVYAAGFGQDGRLRWTSGTVRGFDSTGATTIVAGMPTRGGDSGGPVLDRRGTLVGPLWGQNGEAHFVSALETHRFLRPLFPRLRAWLDRRRRSGQPLVVIPRPQPPEQGPQSPTADPQIVEALGRIEQKLDGVSGRFEPLGQKLDEFGGEVKGSFGAVAEDVVALESRASSLQQQAEEQRGLFEKLKQRVVEAIESRVPAEAKSDLLGYTLAAVAGACGVAIPWWVRLLWRGRRVTRRLVPRRRVSRAPAPADATVDTVEAAVEPRVHHTHSRRRENVVVEVPDESGYNAMQEALARELRHEPKLRPHVERIKATAAELLRGQKIKKRAGLTIGWEDEE